MRSISRPRCRHFIGFGGEPRPPVRANLDIRKERRLRIATVRQVGLLDGRSGPALTIGLFSPSLSSQVRATDRSTDNRPRSGIVTFTEFLGEARREFRSASILDLPARRHSRFVPSPTMRQGYHLQRPSAVVPRTTASRPRSLGRARDRRSDPAVPLVLRMIAVAKAPPLIGRVKLTCLTTV